MPPAVDLARLPRTDQPGILCLAEMGPILPDRAARWARRPTCRSAARLMELYHAWNRADTTAERRRDLGRDAGDPCRPAIMPSASCSEAPQPVVVSNRLRNVPEEAIWAWDPGAHFGIHRMDEFWFADAGSSSMIFLRYAAYRFVTMLLTLLVVSVLIFVIINLPPGDYLSQPDRGAARDGSGRRRRQGGIPAPRIRARPTALAAIPDLGRLHPGPAGVLRADPGQFRLVLRIRPPGLRDRGRARSGSPFWSTSPRCSSSTSWRCRWA